MTVKTTFGYVGFDEFAADLERASLDVPGSLGRPLLPPIEDQIRPHLWRGADIERLLDKLGTLQLAGAEHEGLERRMLRFANPGTPRAKTITQTMSASVQKILPGEVELSHRHTASAVRFFLKGPGTYTTVGGDKCVMAPGDLVVTPYNAWHDYGNEGTEPGIWFDALDFPLVQYLDACGYVERVGDTVGYDTATEPPLPPRVGVSEARYAAIGLRPAWETRQQVERASLIHFRWADTERALRRLAEIDASPYDDVILEYINPVTGDALFPTIGCCIQMLRPGVQTLAHRQASSAVYLAFRGRGTTVVDGRRFDWQQGDVFVVPSWLWHEHANPGGEPAILFSVQDFPAMRALGLYQEEALPERHQTVVA
jgi:gentisate 1,2-dioxygenase